MQEIYPQPLSDEAKNRGIFNRAFLTLLCLVLIAGSFVLGYQRGQVNGQDRERYPIEMTIIGNKEGAEVRNLDFTMFWRIWDLLKEKYVDTDKLDGRKLFYGAIQGMLMATGDPYTSFFDPEANKRFSDEIKGSFEGIGAEIGIKKGILTVIAPLEGSPAERSGVVAGDRILAIDDKSTLEETIDQSVSRMRGPKGTQVKLTVLHPDSEEKIDINIERGVISVKSVEWKSLDDKIAYLKVHQFGDETVKEFEGAIRSILEANPRGLILDLRNNPGGYLDAAARMGSRMLRKGDVVVVEEGKDNVQTRMEAKGGDLLSYLPTVILINEGSASASEILAGALRDNRQNVRIVGMTSFGKGSVQEFIDLPEEAAAVKITVAKWLTPSGAQINNVGIKPDVEVKMTGEDYENDRDPQLDKAVEEVKLLTP